MKSDKASAFEVAMAVSSTTASIKEERKLSKTTVFEQRRPSIFCKKRKRNPIERICVFVSGSERDLNGQIIRVLNWGLS